MSVMEAVARHDATSEALWHGLHERLLGFIRRRVPRRADADDVLQEVFLRIHGGIAGLGDADRAPAWVFRIANNAIADYYRAQARTETLEEDLRRYRIAGLAEEEGPLEEIGRCVEPFLAEIPEPYAEAVQLVDVEGLTHAEAAARLGLSVSGTKSRVQRGRAKLEELLLACCRLEFDARGRVIECHPRADEPARGGGCGCPPVPAASTSGRG